MLTLAMVVFIQAAPVGAEKPRVTDLTIIADYPHLLFAQSPSVRRKIVQAYGRSVRPKWRDIAAAQKMGLSKIQKETRMSKRDRVTGKPIGSTNLFVTRRYAKSDPPPTGKVVVNLASAVAKLFRLLDQLDPKDTSGPDVSSVAIKLLILVEWRAGWCDGEFRKGVWKPYQKGAMFSAPVPLDIGVDMRNAEAVRRFRRVFSKKVGKEPLVQPWVAAFRDPMTGRVADQEQHLKILLNWWTLRTDAIKRTLAEKMPQYRNIIDRLRVEVRAYDPVRVYEGTRKRTLPGNTKAVVWLSQSSVRDDWVGAKFKPAFTSKQLSIARRLNLKYNDALSLIQSNHGSWPSDRHRAKFCQEARAGSGAASRLAELLRVTEPMDWLRKPAKDREPLPYFPSGLVPVSILGDLKDAYATEFEVTKRGRGYPESAPWR